MKNQPEYQLHKAICQWLQLQHPNILFLSDTVASVKLTIPQQVRNKSIQKQGFKCPDLIILHPNKKYSGLFLELKIKSPYKKDGSLYANEHIEGQQKSINDLKKIGYFACFIWDFEQAIILINDYLNDN